MHSEFYQIDETAAKLVNETKRNGGRIICVGTTSCRTVEAAARALKAKQKQENFPVQKGDVVQAGSGWTDIFIYPGYQFQVLDALITNFHLPESTLVMLVSALAGREQVMHAYKIAVEERYRFFSFGDACLIL